MMLIIFNRNLFFFILISITSVMASVIREAKPDKICGETRSVLCVNSMLMAIATTTKIIERLANDIEKHILSNSFNSGELNALMEKEVYSIHAQLPKSKYHDRFGYSNNIDKVDFFCLFLLNFCFLFIGSSWSFTQGSA